VDSGVRALGRLAEQGQGVLASEAGEAELRNAEPRLGLADGALGEQHYHPLGIQAPCREDEGVRGSPVGPLKVVDQAEHRRRLSSLGEQRQRRRRDQERVGNGVVRRPERSAERPRLRCR
jgi:hypothetical protein